MLKVLIKNRQNPISKKIFNLTINKFEAWHCDQEYRSQMTWRFMTLAVDSVLNAGGYREKKYEKKMRTYGAWGLIFDKTQKEIKDDIIRIWMPKDRKFEQFIKLFKLKRAKSVSLQKKKISKKEK